MKRYFILLLTLLFISCGATKSSSQIQTVSNTTSSSTSPGVQSDPVVNKIIDKKDVKSPIDLAKKYAEGISEDDLKKIVYTLADDKFEGRRTGEKGQKLAAEYIIDQYKKLGVKAANDDGNYLQHIPVEYFRGRSADDSENVVAYIKGSEKPEEYIVISAHYDHLGIKGEKFTMAQMMMLLVLQQFY